jgi:hypothetical protein
MVAIINSGKSIRNAFYYNDRKLEKGAASLLMAENYPMELPWMNRDQRLNMLLKTAKKNPIKRPSLHISLNFAPGERLSDELMKQITLEYMEGIGLGNQPYLMYRHHDAAHPHVHIVTHRIGPDSKTIDTYMIGKRKSDPMRIALEKKNGLVKAQHHQASLFDLSPVDVSKVIYSKSETRKSIEDRVNYVLYKYKFTSLSALNAILKGYNIYADRGDKTSRTYKTNGLVYRLIGPGGNIVGKGIRASLLNARQSSDKKPTLKLLQTLFKLKDDISVKERSRVKNAVDLSLKKYPPPSIFELTALLSKEHISMVLHKNALQQIYGVAFVDKKNYCAFKGSDLGPSYSSNAIQRRCKEEIDAPISKPAKAQKSAKTNSGLPIPTATKTRGNTSSDEKYFPLIHDPTPVPTSGEESFLELLMAPEDIYEPLPYELRRRKKKKKKK